MNTDVERSSEDFDNAGLDFDFDAITPDLFENVMSHASLAETEISLSPRDHAALGKVEDDVSVLFVDNNDKVQAARHRSTLAARKHRQKKVSRVDKLEAKIRALEVEKEQWKEKAARWKIMAERNLLAARNSSGAIAMDSTYQRDSS